MLPEVAAATVRTFMLEDRRSDGRNPTSSGSCRGIESVRQTVDLEVGIQCS
jgi:hypothetical protein